MAIFRETDRESVLGDIAAFAEQNERVIALIVVGSGAYGYIDELSDLDMVVATDSNESIEAVMDDIASHLNRRLNIVYFKQVPQRRLQVYLSDQSLEIDIGYGAYTGAAAMRKHWKVLFDKSGTVDEAMRRSWEKREEAPKADETVKKAVECADTVWHHLMHAAVAIKRQRYWRAVAEMELARNLYIGLLGCRYSLDTGRNRDTDELPEAELSILKNTLPADLSPGALWPSLEALSNAAYTELERVGEPARVAVDRRQIEEYIDFCRARSDKPE